MSTPERTKDPENYRRMSEPFEGPEAANKALKDFFTELGDLRKKHRIADCLTVVSINVKYEDGEEGSAMLRFSFGDPLKPVSLAAWLYGREQADHREMINKMLKQAP